MCNLNTGGEFVEKNIFKYSFKLPVKPLTALSVYNVGYEQCKSDFKWGPGIRDHFLIHYVSSGKGIYSCEGKQYKVKGGDLFLAYPNTTISYSSDSSDPFCYYWVGFNGSDAMSILARTDFALNKPIVTTEYGEKIKELLLNIYSSRGTSPHSNIYMTARLYDFLAFLVEISTQREEDDQTLSYLKNAVEFIEKNYSSRITVDDIAKSIGISRSCLYRTFVKYVNTPPVNYLSDFRINQACNILRNNRTTIEVVAYSVGFDDPLYFSRVFKNKIGMTPSEYSKKERNSFQEETDKEDKNEL